MAAILGGIAAAGVLGGGYLASQSSSSAAHNAQDSYNQQSEQQIQRLLNQLYGSGSVYQSNLSDLHGLRPSYGADGILGRMQGISDQFKADSGNILSGYNADTANLMGNYKAQTNQLDTLGAGAEGMAKQWGAGRAGTIRTDAANSLKNANRMGDAALNAGGFNSPTQRANQYGQNASTNQLNMQKSLQDLAGQQIGMQMGARQQRTSTLADRLGNETSLAANRAQGSTQLRTGFLGTQSQLNAAPLQTELQAGQSSIMNPYLNQNTSAYYPGGSALGGALQSIGQTAGGLAGYNYASGKQNSSNQSLLEQLKALMGGGGGMSRGDTY